MNLADYFTKHHPPAHHRNMRKEFLTPKRVIEEANLEEAMMARCYAEDPAKFREVANLYVIKRKYQ